MLDLVCKSKGGEEMSDTKLNKVAGYRAMLGLSQHEMGKILGMSKQQFSTKERGIYPFSDKEKETMKNYLIRYFPNITIDDIFF